MATSTPAPVSRPATSGIMATRRSPARVSVGTASFTRRHQSTPGAMFAPLYLTEPIYLTQPIYLTESTADRNGGHSPPPSASTAAPERYEANGEARNRHTP